MTRLLQLVLRRVTVDGPSMLPTYLSGQRLTAVRPWRPIRVGDVVVARDPRNQTRWVVKRCVARTRSMLDLRGDNPTMSTDSREFGLVARRDVRWLVLKSSAAPSLPPE